MTIETGAPKTITGHGPNPFIIAVLVMLVAALVQATLVSRIRFLGACPNLILVMVVSWALLKGVLTALPIAFVAGLFFDLLAGLPLGVSSLGLMATTFLAGLGTRRVFASNVLWPAFIVALATPVYAFFVLTVLQFTGLKVDWAEMAVQVVAPELVLNVLLTLVVYPTMRGVMQVRH